MNTPKKDDGTSEAATAMTLPRQSVLVVDDEENFLTLLKWYLSQRGYDVHAASSADEAFSFLQEHPVDVALLDIRLGGRDGLSLLEQISEHSPGLKVIMMTAYPTVNSIKQAFDRGAARYLTKPVDLQELADALR
jgi:DNA-binding NtrC family response regulator